MVILNGKRILVTGAGRGLGRFLASSFASDGANVIVNYSRSAVEADSLVTEIKAAGGTALAIRADVSDHTDVARMFDQIRQYCGGLDILINNAGLNIDRSVVEMKEEEWDAVLGVNLKGSFLCSQAAARMMTASGADGGSIVSMTSSSSLTGRKGGANYACSKAAINMLTKCLALELGPTVTANSIALGYLDSPLVRELFTRDQMDAAIEVAPAHRMGEFEEVAGLIRYLTSSEASFITGQTVNLDGGRVMR